MAEAFSVRPSARRMAQAIEEAGAGAGAIPVMSKVSVPSRPRPSGVTPSGS